MTRRPQVTSYSNEVVNDSTDDGFIVIRGGNQEEGVLSFVSVRFSQVLSISSLVYLFLFAWVFDMSLMYMAESSRMRIFLRMKVLQFWI